MQRVVLHIDMDAFFAAVETLGNPHLRGRPVIVGGDPGTRSVVAAASYEARRFGIKAGMPSAEAYRLCPHGVFLGGNPAKYIYYSVQLLEILRRFSPFVEPFSIDEAFLDLTGQVESLVEGARVAGDIHRQIHQRLELTASVGIAPNKLIAKMASKVDKPAGLTMLDRQGFRDTFWPLPTQALWGVGEKTATALAAMRIRTIGELAHAPKTRLERAFGVVGAYLRAMSRGEDATPVIPYFEGVPAKSMGHEFTLGRDESDPSRIESHLLRLTDQVARRLRAAGVVGKRVMLKLRFTDFSSISRQRTLEKPTAEERVILAALYELMHFHLAGRSVRLVGVSVGALTRAGGESGYLFPADQRIPHMACLIDSLRDRFGENVLIRARVLGLHHRGRSGPPTVPTGESRSANRRSRAGGRQHARASHWRSFSRRGPRQL